MNNNIFKTWIFDHAQYVAVYDSMVTNINRVLNGSTPIVFPLLGDSRTGKTALLKDVCTHFADNKSSSGHNRVIFVSMPATASNEALADRIIKTIVGNISVKGKPHQIIDQARLTMETAGVQVLLVDEVNHLVEKRTSERAQSKENRHAADWFKELGDMSNISVVVAGLTHVSRMYTDNDQLENRGLVGGYIHPYAWSAADDRKQYQNTIQAGMVMFEERGWKIEVPLDLITRVSYFGGGGYIGKARDFLVRIEEVGGPSKRVDHQLLSRAYQDKYRLDNRGDPLLLTSIDDVLLNGAHRKAIGRAVHSGRGSQP